MPHPTEKRTYKQSGRNEEKRRARFVIFCTIHFRKLYNSIFYFFDYGST